MELESPATAPAQPLLLPEESLQKEGDQLSPTSQRGQRRELTSPKI